MGNSLLDVIVFGRNAGKKAAAKAKEVELGTPNLDHLKAYADELDAAGADTGMYHRFFFQNMRVTKDKTEAKAR